MDMNEYQALTLRTANMEDFSQEDALTNAALGLCGEAGEFADLLKKHRFQGHPLMLPALVEEIGDILWYCALAASAIGVSLSYAAKENNKKLQARYPDGFDPERSIYREGNGAEL